MYFYLFDSFRILRNFLGNFFFKTETSSLFVSDYSTSLLCPKMICIVHYLVLSRYGHGYEIFSLAYEPGSHILASACKVISFVYVPLMLFLSDIEEKMWHFRET